MAKPIPMASGHLFMADAHVSWSSPLLSLYGTSWWGAKEKKLSMDSVPRAQRGTGLGRAEEPPWAQPAWAGCNSTRGWGEHPMSNGALRCHKVLEGCGDLDSGLSLPFYGEHRLGQEGTKVSWVLAPEHSAWARSPVHPALQGR